MIRISKPETSTDRLVEMLNKAFKTTQNVTIDINTQYDTIDTNNRITRKEVGNPYVLYIYWGYDTARQHPTWEGKTVNIQGEMYCFKQYESSTIQYMCPRIQNEFVIQGEFKDFAYAVGNTVWIMSPAISQRLLNNIAKYSINPSDYIKTKTVEALKKTYKKILEKKQVDARRNIERIQQDINEYKMTQSNLYEKLEAAIFEVNSIETYLEDFYQYFNNQINILTRNPLIESVNFDLDNGSLNVRTKEIIAYGGGDFNILIAPLTIYAGRNSYYVTDCDNLVSGYGGKQMPHPHFISHSVVNNKTVYTACLGNIEHDLTSALEKQDIFQAVDLIIQFLQQYNINDLAGKRYLNWPKA